MSSPRGLNVLSSLPNYPGVALPGSIQAEHRYPRPQPGLRKGPYQHRLFHMSNPSPIEWLNWQAFQWFEGQKRLMLANSPPLRHGDGLDSHCFRKGALQQKLTDRSLASRSWHSLSARDNRLDVVSQLAPQEYLGCHGIFLMESLLTRVTQSILAPLVTVQCCRKVHATRGGLKSKGFDLVKGAVY